MNRFILKHNVASRSYAIIFALLLVSLGVAVPTIYGQQLAQNATWNVAVGGASAVNHSQRNGYTPSILAVRAGDTVVWKDIAGEVAVPHTVTSVNVTSDGKPLFDSSPKFNFSPQVRTRLEGPGGFLPPGGSYVLDTITLSPGTYRYQCTLHAEFGMKGRLTVTGEAASPGVTATVTAGWNGGDPTGSTEITAFAPANITVAKGTRVIFNNLAFTVRHNVVSEAELSNGTTILGSLFDSSPNLVPPGISEDALKKAPLLLPVGPGGVLLPTPGRNSFGTTFATPGTYQYYCKIHTRNVGGIIVGMVGYVVVLPSFVTDQELNNIRTSVTATQNNLQNISQTAQNSLNLASNAVTKNDLGLLASQVNTLTILTYIALIVAIVLGAVAIVLSVRRKKLKA